jgi:predicted Rossmann fold nucleotide-binding protein DprA/Smf involved in DNA uptake
MPTPRTDASPRILAALGSETLTSHQICARTGMSVLALKSSLNAMRKHGEVKRTKNADGHFAYSAKERA